MEGCVTLFLLLVGSIVGVLKIACIAYERHHQYDNDKNFDYWS